MLVNSKEGVKNRCHYSFRFLDGIFLKPWLTPRLSSWGQNLLALNRRLFLHITLCHFSISSRISTWYCRGSNFIHHKTTSLQMHSITTSKCDKIALSFNKSRLQQQQKHKKSTNKRIIPFALQSPPWSNVEAAIALQQRFALFCLCLRILASSVCEN